MIAGIVWRAALIVIALVTIGVQLDRHAKRVPSAADSVPSVLRSSAQLPIAAYAVAGEEQSALEEAELLVRRRPLPAEHLRVLAQAQANAGLADEAALTVQYAARRGWRDPLIQEGMLRLAWSAGDTSEAARRYTALFLRRDTQDALLEEFGAAILGEAGGDGRKTLIEIVGGGERWHNQFLRRGARVLPTDAFVEVIEETIAQGTQYECAGLEQAQRTISTRDEAAGLQLVLIIEAQCV